MSTVAKKETACTCIDIRNISTHLKNTTDVSDNDYEAMIQYLNRNYENKGVFGYDARITVNGKDWDAQFHKKLENSGIKLILEDSPNKDAKQGFVDVAMSNSIMLDIIPKLRPDRVIIMSGDGDLIDTVRRLVARNIKVTVAAFRVCMKYNYTSVGADVVYLDSVPVLKLPVTDISDVQAVAMEEATA